MNLDLELGDLCAERGCYLEPAMMSGHWVGRVGQDRHSPTQSLSYRSVWDRVIQLCSYRINTRFSESRFPSSPVSSGLIQSFASIECL